MLCRLSAMALKRAMTEGAGAAYHQPLLTGMALFAGFGLNVLALQGGDVSVVAPLLGTKVLFVAAFTMLVAVAITLLLPV